MPQEETLQLITSDLQWIRAKSKWCKAVVDHFGMRCTTAELASRILLRYLLCGRCAELPTNQVVASSTPASLRIAMIVNEQSHMPRSELVRMGENSYTEEDIRQIECHIFHCLENDIVSPTIETYVIIYLGYLENLVIGIPTPIQQVVEELTCLAIQGLLFLEYPVQLLALGVVVLALQLCHRQGTWEAQVSVLYVAIGVEEGSSAANVVSEVCASLVILHQLFPQY